MTETAQFMADARRIEIERGADLPEAPLAMPDQDLSHLRATFTWRRMRADALVRS